MDRVAKSETDRDLLERIISRLDRGLSPDNKWPDSNGEYWGLCPYHKDSSPGSFAVSLKGYKCFSCGSQGGLQKLAQKLSLENIGPNSLLNSTGLGLAQYSQEKGLPIDFLQDLGISERKRLGAPSLVIPYFDEQGQEVSIRYRSALSGRDRFRWKNGNRLIPYGVWKLEEVLLDCTQNGSNKPYIFIVEGESDAQTLIFYKIPVLGIPSASTWKPEWAEYCNNAVVYIWHEPDQGGEEFVRRIGESIPEAMIVEPPPGRKDISECHTLGENIPELISSLMKTARPYREIENQRKNELGKETYAKAQPLLNGDILNQVISYCRLKGLVGEEDEICLLYLIITSRLLERPVSIVFKGPSSGGKSYVAKVVLPMFPPSAYYILTSMSEKALAYSKEPLQHRMLVIFEVAGLNSDFASYLLRSLLSEGYIRYETIEKTSEGLIPKLIERPGPTGVVLTTTAITLHPENETRMISITITDDPCQTKEIMRSLAAQVNGKTLEGTDPDTWHALQNWLEVAGVRKFSIPYATVLAEMTNPTAVRIRRDFSTVLNLIGVHAILYQCQRQITSDGRVIATIDDYRTVYKLVANLIGEGVDRTVSKAIRETIDTVERLITVKKKSEVTLSELITSLQLDKSSVSRRVNQAIHLGYLINLENKRGWPKRLALGSAMPDDKGTLPSPEELENKFLCLPVNNNATLQHPCRSDLPSGFS